MTQRHPMVAAYVEAMLARADPVRARQMAAYMKTDMPFYGVSKVEARQLIRRFKTRFGITNQGGYESLVRELWALPRREDKYMAIEVARMFPDFVGLESIPLYRDIVVEGAWWDLVDDAAANLVGPVFLAHHDNLVLTLRRWAQDGDLWLRRTALLAQLKHKDRTDEELLFGLCRAMFHEREFFIRKAIGWALRQYSYTAPGAVLDFLKQHRSEMSGLSYREGAKVLVRKGYDVEAHDD